MDPWQNGVAILGATGTVGRELVRLFRADGVPVHAVGRNESRLAELAAATGANTHRADLTDDSDAARIAAGLRDQQLGLAIATIGGWYVEERGLRVPMSRWDGTIASNLTAHFVAARAFAPTLGTARGVYLALNGIASHYPCEGSIAVSVAGAGQRMMLDVLAAEGRADAVRYAELVIDTPVLMPGETHDNPEPTHTIEQVYAEIRTLAASAPRSGTVARRHLG